MRRQDFHFELPEELIAQRPPEHRGASRLLVLDRADGSLIDGRFAQLPDFLTSGDLLVFNNTRVIPARLLGRKDSGGRVELLLERILDPNLGLAQIRASKSPRTGSRLYFEADAVEVTGREGQFFRLRSDRPLLDLLERHGHVPLPPYIQRPDDELDAARYQTVYATVPGAVAAPTAGLHFTEGLLDQLRDKGVDWGFLTLHVGAGTFSPMRVDDLAAHQMHAEWGQVSAELADQIDRTRASGGRVIAVGTTSVRTLSAAWNGRRVAPWCGDTDLFIHPGVAVPACDGLITNFHLPQSTLIMLVSALAGREKVLAAYRHAVNQRYRFFSYGDAMFITCGPAAVADAV